MNEDNKLNPVLSAILSGVGALLIGGIILPISYALKDNTFGAVIILLLLHIIEIIALFYCYLKLIIISKTTKFKAAKFLILIPLIIVIALIAIESYLMTC